MTSRPHHILQSIRADPPSESFAFQSSLDIFVGGALEDKTNKEFSDRGICLVRIGVQPDSQMSQKSILSVKKRLFDY